MMASDVGASARPRPSRDGQQHLSTCEPGQVLFQAVVENDFESIANTFATNARNSLVSYMSMKSRWARQQDSMAKSGKLTLL